MSKYFVVLLIFFLSFSVMCKGEKKKTKTTDTIPVSVVMDSMDCETVIDSIVLEISKVDITELPRTTAFLNSLLKEESCHYFVTNEKFFQRMKEDCHSIKSQDGKYNRLITRLNNSIHILKLCDIAMNQKISQDTLRRCTEGLSICYNCFRMEMQRHVLDSLKNSLDVYMTAVNGLINIISCLKEVTYIEGVTLKDASDLAFNKDSRNANIKKIPYLQTLYDKIRNAVYDSDGSLIETENVEWEMLELIKKDLEEFKTK